MKITIHGSTPSKKNNKQIFINRKTGKRFITSSESYKTWHSHALMQVKGRPDKHRFGRTPVSIVIDFVVENLRPWDLSNKVESVMDLLVDAGVIEDDNRFVARQLLVRWHTVTGGDRVEIEINQL
jgi:Holliday junction resolvase RusA-like endonuclease